jgi:hypothetical protein
MKSSIGKKFAFIVLAAGALLFTVVLPAEYGIDPTGLGKVLGLTTLASQEKTINMQPFESVLSFNVEEYDMQADVINQSVKGLIKLQPTLFKTEVIDINIEDLGEVEHKFITDADATFVYSWEVLNAKGDGVYFDFHGHPSTKDAANYPDGFEMAYSKNEGTTQSGSFTAQFPGYHGFYFMNLEEGPITVRLKISGYWEKHKEMYRAVDGKVITSIKF